MDSGNSGSIQSSSGGGDEQEYDSRGDSISAYFNPPPPPPPPYHNHHNSNSSLLFDPNSLLNFDPIWSKPIRSDPNCTETNPIFTSSPPNQPFFRPSSSPPVRLPPLSENNNTVTATTTTPRASTDHALGARSNPKKRSRASRRAPTTVLTTDTTNFRAMVQEFTGIPPPPFSSSSSPFNRSSGLDLFGTPSSIRSNSFLLRPFAQKFQPPPLPPFLSPPAPPATTISNSTSINFQMQNPIPIFDPKKNPLPNLSNGSLELIPSNDTSHLKMGVLDEYGLGHGLSNRSNLFSLDGNDRLPMGWGGAGVGPNNTDQSHLRSVNGNYDQYSHETVNVNGNLVNFSASSSDFHGEKGSENVSIRGEATVEPWICSSD